MVERSKSLVLESSRVGIVKKNLGYITKRIGHHSGNISKGVANGSAGSPIIDGSKTAKPTLQAIVPRITTGKCAAFFIEAAGLTPKAEFYGRELNNNWAMRDLIKYCKRKGLLIELGGEARLVIRSERGLARKLAPFQIKNPYFIRICYVRIED